jgi:Fic family protein
MSKYKPPFTITSKIVNLISEISEEITRIEYKQKEIITPLLRKKNRIKTIVGTLEIECNFLGEEKITAIIEGNRVLGTMLEVSEVEGAINAYKKLENYRYDKIEDLLTAHKIMMNGILKNAGSYRNVNVGVGNKDGVSHVAPPYKFVPQLMKELFEWLGNSDVHPLIKSGVFHYEFEFIHPFNDGNGRIGRLWQTVILHNWKEVFSLIPTESLIRDNQEEYYNVLELAGKVGESTPFIEFMLDIILSSVKSSVKSSEKSSVKSTVKTEDKILEYLKENPKTTIKEMAEELGITIRGVEKQVAKLKKDGKLSRVGSARSGMWEVLN